MRLLIGLLFTFTLAIFIGLGATWYATVHSVEWGGVTIGAWTARPRTGTTGIDPYSRAVIARSGALPLASGDGVAFLARTDNAGRPLNGRCDVIVSGITPAARYWTLTLYDPRGRLVANLLGRYGFTSGEIVRRSDGSFSIIAAPRARPGNWLPTAGLESYLLLLRLYDTSVGSRDPCQPRNAHAHNHDRGLPMIRIIGWVAAGVLLGGIVHLVTIMVLPTVATRDAYARLSPLTKTNTVTLLPQPAPDETLLPFMDPNFATAVCRYDLSAAPMKVQLPVTPAYTSISFYTRRGYAFYAINDRAAGGRSIELDLMTPEQHSQMQEDEDVTAADRLIVESPTPTGLILMRALAVEPGTMPIVRGLIGSGQCRAQPSSPSR